MQPGGQGVEVLGPFWINPCCIHLFCTSTPHTRSWRSYTACSSSVSWVIVLCDGCATGCQASPTMCWYMDDCICIGVGTIDVVLFGLHTCMHTCTCKHLNTISIELQHNTQSPIITMSATPTPDPPQPSLIKTLIRNPSNLFASLHNQTPTHHASSSKNKHTVLVALFNPSLPTAEGFEHDKLLAFYPSSTPVMRQVAIIGLWIALREFTITFRGPTSHDAVDAVETAQRNLVSVPLADDDPQGPTLLLVAPSPLSVTLGTLRSWLHRLRAALRLVDDPSAAQSVMDCLIRQHPPPTSAHAAPPDAVPFLQPAQKTALSVQCLADSLQLYSLGGVCPVRHVLIAHAGSCLYSSVGLEDTAALHCCMADTLAGVKSGHRPPSGQSDGYDNITSVCCCRCLMASLMITV